MGRDNLRQLLLTKCSKFSDADAIVLSAIIEVESGWQPKLARFEPNFLYLRKPLEYSELLKVTLKTESCFQRFSWGLGQIMGGTARDLGYDGWLPDLCEPSLNMDWTIKFFQRTCSPYVYAADRIAAYNAGSARRLSSGGYVNQGYVDKVLAILEGDPTWKAAKVAVPLSGRPN